MNKTVFSDLKTDISKELIKLKEEFNLISENAEISEENYSLMTVIKRLISQINHQLLFIDSPDGEN